MNIKEHCKCGILKTNTSSKELVRKNQTNTFDDSKYVIFVDDIDMYSLLWIMM